VPCPRHLTCVSHDALHAWPGLIKGVDGHPAAGVWCRRWRLAATRQRLLAREASDATRPATVQTLSPSSRVVPAVGHQQQCCSTLVAVLVGACSSQQSATASSDSRNHCHAWQSCGSYDITCCCAPHCLLVFNVCWHALALWQLSSSMVLQVNAILPAYTSNSRMQYMSYASMQQCTL
jgi:hypothetical protein